MNVLGSFGFACGTAVDLGAELELELEDLPPLPEERLFPLL